MSSCVIKNKDFYSLAEEHGIDGNELELIVHKYWNEVGKEDSFPPSSYINEQLGIGKSYDETSENVRKLWEKDYSRPIKFKSEYELNGAVQKAKTFFPADTITTYKDNKGNFVLRIAEPVTSSSIDKEVQDILAKAPRDNQGRLLAPNGKVSNLTEKQYAQVRTKAFKRWFGDWENPFSQMTGFNIIFGHPAIGKTTALQGKYKDKFIDWDVEYNEKRDRWIEEHTKTKKGTKEFKDARNKYLIYPENYPDYIKFLTREWNRVKNKAKQENKILLVSPHNLLKLFPNDFNYIIDVKSSDFISRNINRGGNEINSKLWKEGIDKTISNVNSIPKYTIKQGVYLSDLLDSANNVSKVVDENGEPLVVWHNANDTYSEFDLNYSPNGFYFGTQEQAFARADMEEDYHPNGMLIQAFLNLRNPKITNFDDRNINKYKKSNDGFIIEVSKEDAEELAFIGNYNPDNFRTEYVVFNPNQIKSATDNIGTFSTTDNNILHDTTVDNVTNSSSISYIGQETATARVQSFIDSIDKSGEYGQAIQEFIDTFGIPVVNEVIFNITQANTHASSWNNFTRALKLGFSEMASSEEKAAVTLHELIHSRTTSLANLYERAHGVKSLKSKEKSKVFESLPSDSLTPEIEKAFDNIVEIGRASCRERV